MIGYFPVAMAFGISASSYGLDPVDSTLISVLIFAGASQFALITLLSQGTSYITTALILVGLNLRHLLYSTTLSPGINHMPLLSRLAIAFGITDEVFATAFTQLKTQTIRQQWFWLAGLELGAYSSWVFGTWIGATSGAIISERYSFLAPALSFALPALFLSLLLPLFIPLSRPLIKNKTLLTVGYALIIALVLHLSGYSTLGLFVAALVAPAIALAKGAKG